MFVASIPSPEQGVWYIGPIPLRAYGLIIVTGMIVAVWWTSKRYAKRGGNPDLLYDVAMWAIPFGIVGARLYHVVTTPENYFASPESMLRILKIWEGGLAIWGGVFFGALGAWIAVRRAGCRLAPVADSLAPALLLAQGIGRWGNYFNQELFGSPTTLPWGLEIDDAHLPAGYPSGTLFHPTFLYESLWNVSMAALIAWADRRFRFKAGQVFALYFFAYPVGRIWMETMRLDEAREFLGIRLNAWTSILMLFLGAAIFMIAGKLGHSTQLLGDERFIPASGGKKAVGSEGVSAESVAGECTEPRSHGDHHDGEGDLAEVGAPVSR